LKKLGENKDLQVRWITLSRAFSESIRVLKKRETNQSGENNKQTNVFYPLPYKSLIILYLAGLLYPELVEGSSNFKELTYVYIIAHRVINVNVASLCLLLQYLFRLFAYFLVFSISRSSPSPPAIYFPRSWTLHSKIIC